VDRVSTDQQFLPFPTWRDLYCAQTGVNFFLKWAICTVWSLALRTAFYLFVTNSGGSANLPMGILFWGLDQAPIACALFGRSWRAGVWVFILPASKWTWWVWQFIPVRGNWIWLITLALLLALQLPVLRGVRGRLRWWVIASIVGGLVELAVFWNTPFHRYIWDFMRGLPISISWLHMSLLNGVSFVQSAVCGFALAWWMPPLRSARGASDSGQTPSR
jgi:hypothetical protein